MLPRVVRIWLGLVFVISAHPLRGQMSPEQEAILLVVTRLFDGMRTGDSAMVRKTFHPLALLATAENRPTGASVRIDTLNAFLKAVGSPHDSVWDERTRNAIVHLDGTLAVVWTEYSFYVGSRFNHCGVDTFQLAKEGMDWRIIALTDTRRRRPCPEQP